MYLNFDLPALNQQQPIWNGQEFIVGPKSTKVLEYSLNNAGWDDQLTFLHEEFAGHNHPIDVASRARAVNYLKKYLPKHNTPCILEVGCSSGFMLADLKKIMPNALLIGADVTSAALYSLAARIPNLPLLQFDLTQCPLPDACIDAMVMLNVLEHIEDDLLALQQAFRILKPGGLLVLEVPAGPHLYDFYDEHLRHFRRYTSQELTDKCTIANFNIIKASHLGFFIYPPFAMVKRRNQQLAINETQKTQLTSQNIKNTQSNKILQALLAIEERMDAWFNYPLGVRCTMVCIKE